MEENRHYQSCHLSQEGNHKENQPMNVSMFASPQSEISFQQPAVRPSSLFPQINEHKKQMNRLEEQKQKREVQNQIDNIVDKHLFENNPIVKDIMMMAYRN